MSRERSPEYLAYMQQEAHKVLNDEIVIGSIEREYTNQTASLSTESVPDEYQAVVRDIAVELVDIISSEVSFDEIDFEHEGWKKDYSDMIERCVLSKLKDEENILSILRGKLKKVARENLKIEHLFEESFDMSYKILIGSIGKVTGFSIAKMDPNLLLMTPAEIRESFRETADTAVRANKDPEYLPDEEKAEKFIRSVDGDEEDDNDEGDPNDAN
ncbi:hypothetical protein KJ903_04145 [Patescibacteria group bacterium]|nr:hypothetical protein [Patescibacteria group bacterium]